VARGLVHDPARVGTATWLIFRDGLDLLQRVERRDDAIEALAGDPVNVHSHAELAPLVETAHDFSDASSDRVPVILELDR
jgi:hypothetical protein